MKSRIVGAAIDWLVPIERLLSLSFRVRRKLVPKGTHVLLACMPKSGSTFLMNLLMEATGFSRAILCYAFERNEQELYLPNLIDNYSHDFVSQIHMRATKPNLLLLNQFEIRPVIQVRNIFDIVVSVRDHLVVEGVERFPSLYATERFVSSSPAEQYDFLIAFALPWYFNFFASWQDVERSNEMETLWVSYEDLLADWAGEAHRIAEFYGLTCTRADLESAYQRVSSRPRKQNRFNAGRSGRGVEMLTEAQRQRIKTLASRYPWADFQRIGL